MIPAPRPLDEAERLATLRVYEILDTGAEREFDDIVEVASRVCGTPIALVSLVDHERQWFKARVGLAESQTSREVSFCAHAILGEGVMVVPDASADERFVGNPLVLAGPRIRFYAGSPLVAPDGRKLGTLCVLDRVPHDLDVGAREILAALSRQVVALLELRRTAARLADALARVRTLGAMIPMCAWCRKVRTDSGYWRVVERYLLERGSEVSHGVCPDCSRRHLGVADELAGVTGSSCPER